MGHTWNCTNIRIFTTTEPLEVFLGYGKRFLVALSGGRGTILMSVWESKQALMDFVYKTDHVNILRKRAEWFVPQNRPVMAVWWLAAGTVPTIAESKRRLEILEQAGPSEDAFTFRHFFASPEAESISGGSSVSLPWEAR